MLEMLSETKTGDKTARRLIFLMQNAAQCYPPTPHLEKEGYEKDGCCSRDVTNFNTPHNYFEQTSIGLNPLLPSLVVREQAHGGISKWPI